jgi:hypothetical protein
MSGCDADYGSQIAVDHHRPVCLRRLGAMKECPPSLPRAADNLPPACQQSCGKACRDAGSCCDLYKAEPTALGAEHTQQQPHARPRIDRKASRTMRGTMISAAAASAHSHRPITRSYRNQSEGRGEESYLPEQPSRRQCLLTPVSVLKLILLVVRIC